MPFVPPADGEKFVLCCEGTETYMIAKKCWKWTTTASKAEKPDEVEKTWLRGGSWHCRSFFRSTTVFQKRSLQKRCDKVYVIHKRTVMCTGKSILQLFSRECARKISIRRRCLRMNCCNYGHTHIRPVFNVEVKTVGSLEPGGLPGDYQSMAMDFEKDGTWCYCYLWKKLLSRRDPLEETFSTGEEVALAVSNGGKKRNILFWKNGESTRAL